MMIKAITVVISHLSDSQELIIMMMKKHMKELILLSLLFCVVMVI